MKEAAKRDESKLRDPKRLMQLSRIRNTLPAEKARMIQDDIEAGMLQKEAVKKHGVNKGTVSLIARGLHVSQRPNLLSGASIFGWAK
jgi:hypothetical protein